MTKIEYASGFILLIFGVVIFAGSMHYPFGDIYNPGAGFAPRIASIILNGTVFQHFNNDTEREAILICAEPNFVNSLGVDRGSGFKVLETAPEYKG